MTLETALLNHQEQVFELPVGRNGWLIVLARTLPTTVVVASLVAADSSPASMSSWIAPSTAPSGAYSAEEEEEEELLPDQGSSALAAAAANPMFEASSVAPPEATDWPQKDSAVLEPVDATSGAEAAAVTPKAPAHEPEPCLARSDVGMEPGPALASDVASTLEPVPAGLDVQTATGPASSAQESSPARLDVRTAKEPAASTGSSQILIAARRPDVQRIGEQIIEEELASWRNANRRQDVRQNVDADAAVSLATALPIRMIEVPPFHGLSAGILRQSWTDQEKVLQRGVPGHPMGNGPLHYLCFGFDYQLLEYPTTQLWLDTVEPKTRRRALDLLCAANAVREHLGAVRPGIGHAMGTVLVSFLETVGRGDGIYGPIMAKVHGRVSIGVECRAVFEV